MEKLGKCAQARASIKLELTLDHLKMEIVASNSPAEPIQNSE